MNDSEIKIILDNMSKWNTLLLDQNKTLFEKVDKINETLAKKDKNDEKRLTRLEIKSGLWGLVGGILSTLGIHVWK
jgi:hypothetical protein